MRRSAIIAIGLCLFVFISSCGGGGGGTSVNSITPESTSVGATISGIIYAPSGLSLSRNLERQAEVSATGKDIPVTDSEVIIKRMRPDGSMQPLGEGYKVTTDGNGSFTINAVPQEDNLIIESTKTIFYNGKYRPLRLRKIISVTEWETSTGSLSGIEVDASTTLCTESMRHVLTMFNQGVTFAEQIKASQLPREMIEYLEGDIQSALALDQTSGNPSVDLKIVATDEDNSLDPQLKGLENSPFGATLKSRKEKARTQGNVRVHVVQINDQGPPIEGATVLLTVNGQVQTGTTDNKGNAFFYDIEPGSSLEIEVNKPGYMMVKTSKNIDRAAIVNNVTVHMTQGEGNQAPIAKAGVDQSVARGSTVTLDGSNSFDPDGDNITYQWEETTSSGVVLSSTTTATATFIAPSTEVITFSLMVSDGILESELDTVTIRVAAVVCVGDNDCDDADPLTLGICKNPATTDAVCEYVTIVCNTASDCDDFDPSTVDSCNNSGTTEASCTHINSACNSDADCDDGNTLTIDTCQNPGTLTSSCLNTVFACNTDADCDDGNSDTADSCSNGGSASSSCNNVPIACLIDSDCDDSNALTIDTCQNASTVSAICENTAIACNSNADCDDSIINTEDTCSNGGTLSALCNNAPIACFNDPECDDANALTLDTCSNPGTALAACDYIAIACNTNSDCAASSPFCTNGGTASSSCIKEIDWVTIPAGDFIMGCADLDTHCSSYYTPDTEKPKHTVTVPEYQILKYEVTNYQYKQCVDAGVCTAPSNSSSVTRASYYGNIDYDNYPVIYVSWNQAKTYCTWIGGRLPSAAEWEKAARGPSPRENIFPWGDIDPTCALANITIGGVACVGDTTLGGTVLDSVSYYDVHNMADNVREWVEDRSHDNYTGAPIDGSAWVTGSTGYVTIRGAGWKYATDISNDRWESRNSWIGFASSLDTGWDFGGIRCTK